MIDLTKGALFRFWILAVFNKCEKRSRLLLMLLTVGLLLTVAIQPVHSASLVGLGDLPGGVYGSYGNAVSYDGSIVVGSSRIASPGLVEATRWTQATGIQGIGFLPFDNRSTANGISEDGSVIVGESRTSSFDSFRWTQAGGMVALGRLPGGTNSRAFGVSADGSVVVGRGSSSNGSEEAYRWTQAGGTVGLGDLSGGIFSSRANDVSADGSVVVGRGTSASGDEAFMWTQAGGMVGLGELPGGIYRSSAEAISSDGSVVVGVGHTAAGQEAMRWTQSGGIESLGRISASDTFSTAYDVSADGSTIVGDSGAIAGVWDALNGMQSLSSILGIQGVDLSAWAKLEQALGVSGDGRTIVGIGRRHDNSIEGFYVELDAGAIPSVSSPPMAGVPVPPAIWLFGTGLVAMFGVARRRTGSE